MDVLHDISMVFRLFLGISYLSFFFSKHHRILSWIFLVRCVLLCTYFIFMRTFHCILMLTSIFTRALFLKTTSQLPLHQLGGYGNSHHSSDTLHPRGHRPHGRGGGVIPGQS
uniref:Uncharacterized protein n=1 Tax=Cacopsylla melanoneura TaxID=428564 RepID=A0A8D8ZR48_9HEMI